MEERQVARWSLVIALGGLVGLLGLQFLFPVVASLPSTAERFDEIVLEGRVTEQTRDRMTMTACAPVQVLLPPAADDVTRGVMREGEFVRVHGSVFDSVSGLVRAQRVERASDVKWQE